jgi:hypothetical protein
MQKTTALLVMLTIAIMVQSASALYAPCSTCGSPNATPAQTFTQVGIDFTISSASIRLGESVTLSAYPTNSILLFPQYTWQTNGNIAWNGQVTVFKPTKKGKYGFMVTMIDPLTLQSGQIKKLNVLTVR